MERFNLMKPIGGRGDTTTLPIYEPFGCQKDDCVLRIYLDRARHWTAGLRVRLNRLTDTMSTCRAFSCIALPNGALCDLWDVRAL